MKTYRRKRVVEAWENRDRAQSSKRNTEIANDFIVQADSAANRHADQ